MKEVVVRTLRLPKIAPDEHHLNSSESARSLAMAVADLLRCTYAAVDAAISNLRAFVHVASTSANAVVKPAIVPIRPPTLSMKYSATIATIGIRALTTLMRILLNRSSFSSL